MRFLYILLFLVTLNGCSWFTTPIAGPATPFGILVAADAISMIDNQKTIGDYIVSAYTGQDCSSYNYYQLNKPYCISLDAPEPPAPPNYYCYGSIGGINCYDSPIYGSDYTQ